MAKMNELYRLFAFGSELKDPRRDHLKKHSLLNIMTISVCAMLAGAEDWTDIAGFGQNYHEWFRQLLEMPHGPPSHDTIRRVFSLLDQDTFAESLSQWLQRLRVCQPTGKQELCQVAIDGKQLKASFDQAGLTQPWLMVSAYATEQGLVLGQQGARGETGELMALHDLLDRLDVKGRLVSLDALGCQKDIAAKIVEKQGDYLLSLKANHPTLEQAARQRLAEHLKSDTDDERQDRDHAVQWEKSHGRQTLRRCVVLRQLEGLAGIEQWPEVQAVVLVATGQDRPVRRVKATSPARKQTQGIRLFLTNWDASAQEYMQAVRNHWLVENQVHWSLDVTFREDASRLRKDQGASNLATMRRITLSLLKADTTKASIKLKRKLAAWNPDKLFQYLGLAPSNLLKYRDK